MTKVLFIFILFAGHTAFSCPSLDAAESMVAKQSKGLYGANTALNFEGLWQEYVMTSGCHKDSLEMYISKAQIKHLENHYKKKESNE